MGTTDSQGAPPRSINADELANLLAISEVIQENDTFFCGPIRIIERDDIIYVQEQSDRDEILVRSFPSQSAAREFVEQRLATYERMWDGCGCRIDYYGS